MILTDWQPRLKSYLGLMKLSFFYLPQGNPQGMTLGVPMSVLAEKSETPPKSETKEHNKQKRAIRKAWFNLSSQDFH